MIILFFILIYFNCHLIVINGLVVTEISFLSAGGKNDYVLTGQDFTVRCVHLLEKVNEIVQTIEILKDGDQVYEHNLETNETQLNGIFKNAVDLIKSSSSSIHVRNATISMHGNYTCKVKSQISCSSQSANLIVINDACKESDWSTRSDMIHCLERIDLQCTGMFPKPSPSCGVYEQNSGRYITAEPITILRKQSDGTYDLSMSHRYSAEDYSERKGSFLFRCMLTIIGTTWSRVINSKLFSRRDCPDPPRIANGQYNVTQRKTCWNTPTEGSIATYYCSPNYTLSHSGILVCVDGTWRQVTGHHHHPNTNHLPEDDINLTTLQFLPVQDSQLPTCNISSISSLAISLIILVTLIHLNQIKLLS
ncbi:uncharacterized protein LOC128390379 [Panonychus citri]|uniref:uncharacterized protein LOC128390379 n=1 Tax=Panonychus citri TaxID=50023 RepID=UPI002307B1DC|nr:uncharacterized protein LOC128390379 [Panonychus citri]